MRRQYPFHSIEPKWQRHWEQEQTFKAFNPGDAIPSEHPFAKRHGADAMDSKRIAAGEAPGKFYILDMFPYPSGAGLHVGHPEGYTATDILARYRRAKGQHVLHPMGWDAFGLPAEQYAVKTGQHPRITTEANVANFTRQIKSLGFSYDWSREVNTTDPDYFKWTQWIFLKLYNSWFNPETNRAEPIETLKYPAELEQGAAGSLPADSDCQQAAGSTLESRRRAYRDSKRLAFVSEAPVNWCPELGTVLANEEVIDGKSEVGGFPVIRKPMRQWMLRITDYAERLLTDLDTIDWSDSLKEMQRNWIGRSEGAEVEFEIAGSHRKLKVFTTRPDTLFGATFMVMAPECRQFDNLIPDTFPEGTPTNWHFSEAAGAIKPAFDVQAYRIFVASLSDLQRQFGKSACFTGMRAINPVNRKEIPIFFSEYVLATYGTGAIMAVPAHDERDFEFATKFNLPITQVVQPPDANTDWRGFTDPGTAINSANSEIDLDGLPTAEAKKKITAWLESKGLGKKTVNYKLRDWLFSRQRYWGEPFPIVWKKDDAGILHHEALPENALPVLPPSLEDYKPTPDGQPPLARAKDWLNLPDGSVRETNTMPQWAGSCWYYLRYLDAQNASGFVGKEAESYWMGTATIDSVAANVSSLQSKKQSGLTSAATPGVDLYVGGTEHAVLHLLYARFWHKVLFDLGYVSTAEPFFKLVNQGIIIGEDGQKMSKSRGNVVNPDDVLKEFGADAFRLYEMFMGPLQDSKPWSTRGVEGVYRFLGRVWRLFIDEQSEKEFELAETTAEAQRRGELLDVLKVSATIQDVAGTPAQLKTLHACIKKVTEDLDGMRFNTAISAMMVFVNDAMTWDIKPWTVMRDFLKLLAPFAPHVTEELWAKLHAAKNTAIDPAPSLTYANWPAFDPTLLVEDTLEIPVQVNGKLRDVIQVSADADKATMEKAALASGKVKPFLDGKSIKKVIVVPKKLVNIVVV